LSVTMSAPKSVGGKLNPASFSFGSNIGRMPVGTIAGADPFSVPLLR
jgi:hypothetical protein